MKKLLATALLSGLTFVVALSAQAQSTAPDFPTAGQGNSEAGARRNSRATAEELTREQRRASMSPEDAKMDQQMQLLEARAGFSTGNTSFSRTGPDRQMDSKGGGFRVKKYKAKPGSGEQKRGMTHMASGIDPKGKPLVHKHKQKNKFLLF